MLTQNHGKRPAWMKQGPRMMDDGSAPAEPPDTDTPNWMKPSTVPSADSPGLSEAAKKVRDLYDSYPQPKSQPAPQTRATPPMQMAADGRRPVAYRVRRPF